MDWQDYHSWCRLCGNYETIVKIELEIEEITSKLIDLSDGKRSRICVKCHEFLNEIYQFVAKSRLIEAMFVEIQNQLDVYQSPESQQTPVPLEITRIEDGNRTNVYDINAIRIKYGCKPLEPQLESLNNLFDEGALEIKLESSEFDLQEMIPEETSDEEDEEDEEDDDNNEEEDEIQELNKIQFQKHRESSSESDKEDQKERKRKPKKNEEEKLFDFICHICKEEFDKMCFLSRHCRSVHRCLPEVNCFCGKQLGTWKRLMIHKQLHFPEKFDYECKECKLIYKLRASYENHMRAKHGPDAKKFVCSQCARCFKDSRTLMAHEKTHLPDDLKLTHPCSMCGKKFVNKNSLKSHITSVHEMANLYTCETCGKGFSTKSNLKSHLYVHSTIKDVQCDICSSRFKNMDSLRKHKKTHLEKSHECKICGNRYRNRNNLKAHMVCHSDVKAYSCSFCPNSYKRSKDLKCHLNLHTGERPYTCHFCSRTFVNGSNCRKHKLKDHPEQLAAFEAIHGRGKLAIQALHQIHQEDS